MKLAACVIVRNEERAIAEWIAFHGVVGFDTLIVFDNVSTDRTSETARALGASHDVRLIPWPETGQTWQTSAYDHALAAFGAEFDWIAFIDSDEFILPLGARDLRPLLMGADPAAAVVVVAWMMFGSSGHRVRPPELVTQAYHWRSDAGFGPNRHVKSIVRPGEASSALNPHCFSLKGEEPGSDARHVDPTGAPVHWTAGCPGLLAAPAPEQGARVNHYFVKSYVEWERKVARGYNGTDSRALTDFAAYDQDVVHDTSADRYLPAVKQALRQTDLAVFSDLSFE